MRGRPDEFMQFVRPHWERLRLVARQYAQSGADALDLTQETLLRAWRAFSPAEVPTYRPAWLFVILRNVAAEWHRASGRRIRIAPAVEVELTALAPVDLSESLAALPTMDEAAFREFLDDRMASAIDGLDAPFREVIVLSVAGGLNYREIAEVLDCPAGTVMSRMARARRALRDQLGSVAKREGWVREKRP